MVIVVNVGNIDHPSILDHEFLAPECAPLTMFPFPECGYYNFLSILCMNQSHCLKYKIKDADFEDKKESVMEMQDYDIKILLP